MTASTMLAQHRMAKNEAKERTAISLSVFAKLCCANARQSAYRAHETQTKRTR